MAVLLYSLAENLPISKIDSACFAVNSNGEKSAINATAVSFPRKGKKRNRNPGVIPVVKKNPIFFPGMPPEKRGSSIIYRGASPVKPSVQYFFRWVQQQIRGS
jgi:hypothetical protein